ncbi:N-acetylated-alpha-linked acidic dipeptidase [Saccharata proteae CBS 121410]|uniref:N-acetylated-alpha-linked acidic dipeptidase n=1 Tax=Saccharata proteae CBS 121410 TaxID=1314787 RepID=A0A9P4LSS6_9PEZI|nr:N-acetylated-alpha-linked acidic dipeptidase [Saccharata proteae CBS 121410]
MGDEKHAYDPKESLPIPTYEEATSSRPASSLSHLGPAEVSDDAERQGLLGRSGGGNHNRNNSGGASRRRDGYQQPSVESVRDSMESDITMPEASDSEDEEEGLHREMEQLEVIDGDAEAGASRRQRRLRLGMSFSKRISSLTTTLSSLHLPRMPRVPFRMPSFSVQWWPTIPEHLRPGYSVLFRVFGVLLIASLVYALMVTSVFPTRGIMGSPFNPEWARSFVQSNILPARISDNLRHITSVDHVAGSKGNKYLADWMEHFFLTANMDEVGQQNYKVYLNYPRQGGRRVAIVEPAELAWEAIIEEDLVSPDLKSNQQTMVFHGLSRAGNVTGPLVYANYGSKEDFKKLKDDGIDLKGAIVLVRYYGTQTDRGMKVKFAEEAGAAGCLIYSDPKDDGFVRGDVYPDGRWRTKDSVQRGSVALTPWIVGDVLTPGWASVEGAETISTDDNPALVNIPSLPLAWRDAQRLLQVLEGHGEKVPETWVGGVPEIHEWWSGDQKSPIVHLMNEQEEDEKHDIYNVLGVIEGIETKAKKIYVGNHRDSWCFGSADPGSGTAIMLEVITALDLLVQQGWRPLRTIVFASWDAEEYNMIGSTEFVEDHLKDVRDNGIAYLNVDVGVVGDKFRATGSPIFEQVLGRVLGRVGDPVRNVSLGKIWNSEGGRLEGLGAGSDYVAFSSLAGCSSIDIGFEGPENGFPYHSCYETFDWMDKFGDPGFLYHKALAEIWALLILEIAQEPIYPLSLQAYGAAVQSYINDLESYAVSKGADASFDVKPLRSAADVMQRNAKEFDQFDDEWWSQFRGRAGYETNAMAMERLSHNARMTNFDTHLLDLPRDPHKDDGKQHGVPGREQYKHIIFGPDAWSGYDEAFFPAVRDAVEAGDWELAQKQVNKAADILKRASEKLLH